MSREPRVARQTEENRKVVNYFKTSSIIPIFKYIFLPVPGIFLILGKLINKLKHHLSPGLSVLYDRVVGNENKTVLSHEASSASESRLQPLGRHPQPQMKMSIRTLEFKIIVDYIIESN